MKLLNILHEWLPVASGAAFVAVVGSLVALSLLPPEREDNAQPPPQLPSDTCLVMPDGRLRICDDVAAPSSGARP